MKIIISLIFLFFSLSVFAQETASKLLNSSEKEIISHMHDNLPDYVQAKEILEDTLHFKTLRFVYKINQDSELGVLCYAFYFDNPVTEKCTNIRVYITTELKFRYAVRNLTAEMEHIDVNEWYDSENNISLKTYFFKRGDILLYFLDIKNYHK